MTTHSPLSSSQSALQSHNQSISPPLWRELAPVCLVVFLEFLAMGLPLPVLPLRVHGALGFGSFVVGLAIGAQSWITLLTRHAAGTRSDSAALQPRRLYSFGARPRRAPQIVSTVTTSPT